MRHAWSYRALGDVCHVIGGGTPRKNNVTFYRGEIPWATVRDMRHPILQSTEYKISESAVCNSSTNIIPAGNVVIATRVGLGKVCMLAQDTAINQDLRGLIPKNASQLDVYFLFWWLRSIAPTIEKEGRGATVKGVKLPFIRGLQLPLPSLEQQRRIARSLAQAFDILTAGAIKIDQNLRNARVLLSAERDAMFARLSGGWHKTTLGEVCTLTRGPFGGSLTKQEFTDAGYAVYEQQHAINNQFNSVRYFIRAEKFKAMKRFELLPGDLVMSCSGTMGRVAIAPENILPGIINQALLKLTPSSAVSPAFLQEWMNSGAFQRALRTHMGGAAIQNVASVKVLKAIEIRIPNRTEQERLVQRLRTVQGLTTALQSSYVRKLAKLDELGRSLLHAAFSGGL